MNLRDLAALDAQRILESDADAAVAVSLIDPAGVITLMKGHTGDINALIETETGAIIRGRRIDVRLSILSLPAGPRPVAKTRQSEKVWRVSFPRVVTGFVTEYAVVGTSPDDSMGIIILELGNLAS